MKNKYGLIGFLSLLGLIGVFTENRLFLSWFGFIAFFQYFWIVPDELFIETMRKCAAAAFFVNLAVTGVITLVFTLLGGLGGDPLTDGVIFGFTAGLFVFVFSTVIIEWRQRRSATDD